MRFIHQICRLSLIVLSIFVILVVVSTQMTPSDHDGADCDSIPVSVAVLPWPPYVGNVSNDFQSRIIQQLNDEIILRPSLDRNPITFRKTSSESELKKLFKANQADIGFPLIRRYSSASGEIDSVTSNREYSSASSEIVIEDHPGLEFLVAPQTPSPGEVCMNTLRDSWPLLALSLILSGMAGILIWLMEVIGNREEFPRSFARGSWEGFWWAFISMTTVGYGDKCPRSVAGRCLAIIWIFAGLILVAVFMASVTTALTSVSIKPEYKLSETQVGVVSKSLEEELARNNGAEVKVFKNYDELMTAFRQRRIPGIVIDRYTAGIRLENETGTFRQYILQGKHFSLRNKYQLIANISSNFEIIINIGRCHNFYKKILNCIEEVITKHLLEREIQGMNNSSSTTTHSFNLFIESKAALEEATYISIGVLVALVCIGLVVDKIFRKARSHKMEEHELKVHEDDDMMEDIAKGRKMLNELQLLHQKLEQKIKLNSARKRKSEIAE